MQERSDLESMVRQRAQREPEFRARLVESPRATLEEALEMELGEVRVRVVEEQPGEVVFVLPPPATVSADLTDAELAGVAGGGSGWQNVRTSCRSECNQYPYSS